MARKELAIALEDYGFRVKKCASIASTLETALHEGHSYDNEAYGYTAGTIADLLNAIYEEMNGKENEL
jgi:hypothetical protein